MNFTSEKMSLLPVTEHTARSDDESSPRKVSECVLMYFCIVLAALQFFIHFNLYSLESRLGAYLDLLAQGFCMSIPASLPTATILFIAVPWIARPECTAITRYTILLCYLVGSSLGAWLLTRDLQAGLETWPVQA